MSSDDAAQVVAAPAAAAAAALLRVETWIACERCLVALEEADHDEGYCPACGAQL